MDASLLRMHALFGTLKAERIRKLKNDELLEPKLLKRLLESGEVDILEAIYATTSEPQRVTNAWLHVEGEHAHYLRDKPMLPGGNEGFARRVLTVWQQPSTNLSWFSGATMGLVHVYEQKFENEVLRDFERIWPEASFILLLGSINFVVAQEMFWASRPMYSLEDLPWSLAGLDLDTCLRYACRCPALASAMDFRFYEALFGDLTAEREAGLLELLEIGFDADQMYGTALEHWVELPRRVQAKMLAKANSEWRPILFQALAKKQQR